MTTYLINIENTGLTTAEQVAAMAEILQAKGYDVETTQNFGDINPGAGVDEPLPFEGGQGLQDWEDALIAADAAHPAD